MKKIVLIASSISFLVFSCLNVSSETLASGISQECYNEVKEAVNKYYCDDFKENVESIYTDYGTEKYSSYIANRQIQKKQQDIGMKFADIYDKYKDTENRDLILFGYNFSLLVEMQYENSAMQTKVNHYKEMEDYYNEFVNDPTPQLCADFCTYINENKILHYAESIETTTDKELAKEAYEKMQIASIKMQYCVNMITIDPETAYDSFLDGTDALLYVFDQQDTYPNLRGYLDYSTGKNIAGLRDVLNVANKDFIELLHYHETENEVMFNIYGEELLENFAYLFPAIDNMYENTEIIKNSSAAFAEKAVKVELQRTALDEVDVSWNDGDEAQPKF